MVWQGLAGLVQAASSAQLPWARARTATHVHLPTLSHAPRPRPPNTNIPPCLPARPCRDQVVEFILANTAADTSAAPSGTYVDPYGAGAYVPPPPSAPGAAAAGGFAGGSADPFTGAGAYVPAASGGGVTGGGADPFTGGGAAPPRHVPAKAYLVYDQVGAG